MTRASLVPQLPTDPYQRASADSVSANAWSAFSSKMSPS